MIFISELHKDIVCGHVHVYGHTHRKSIWHMNTDAKPFNKMPSKKLAVVPGQWSVSHQGSRSRLRFEAFRISIPFLFIVSFKLAGNQSETTPENRQAFAE